MTRDAMLPIQGWDGDGYFLDSAYTQIPESDRCPALRMDLVLAGGTIEVRAQELSIDELSVRANPDHMVLMDAVGYFASEESGSANLRWTPVPLNDKNISRLQPPALKLLGADLEEARI
jgi:hypothetical protein